MQDESHESHLIMAWIFIKSYICHVISLANFFVFYFFYPNHRASVTQEFTPTKNFTWQIERSKRISTANAKRAKSGGLKSHVIFISSEKKIRRKSISISLTCEAKRNKEEENTSWCPFTSFGEREQARKKKAKVSFKKLIHEDISEDLHLRRRGKLPRGDGFWGGRGEKEEAERSKKQKNFFLLPNFF